MSTQKRRTRATSAPRTRRTARPTLVVPEGFDRRLRQTLPQIDLVEFVLLKHEVRASPGGACRGAAVTLMEVRLVISQFLVMFDALVAEQQKARGAR